MAGGIGTAATCTDTLVTRCVSPCWATCTPCRVSLTAILDDVLDAELCGVDLGNGPVCGGGG